MTSFEYSPYIVPLVLAAIISGWAFFYSWQRRSARVALALSLLALAIIEWSLGYALEIAGADLATKLFWGKLQYIGIATVPMLWVIFAYYYANPGRELSVRNAVLLAIVPIVTVFLALTTERHGLVWKTFEIKRVGSFSALTFSYGPAFWVYWVYSYLLVFAGTFIAGRALRRAQGLYRGQVAMIVLGLSAPWIGNFLYVSGLSPIAHLDLTPFAFTVTVVAMVFGLFGYQLGNISPIARDILVDNMPEGMIVINTLGRIVDINPAAGRMIGIPAGQSMGRSIEEVLAPWPELITLFRDAQEGIEQIAFGTGEGLRHYEVRIVALHNRQNVLLGRMISLREVDAASAPAPKFTAKVSAAAPVSYGGGNFQARVQAIPVIGGFLGFILTPLKTDLVAPPNINPAWHQARERSFTLILRVAALIGTLALLVAPSFSKLEAGLPFAIIVILIWTLGLLRNLNFQLRTITFQVLLYLLATIEVYNFGYSVASFTFYMALVISANLLLGRNGALATFAVTVVTLAVFGIEIGRGSYLPVNAHEGIPVPGTIQRALTSLLAFSASAGALISAVTILMESLNRAWQMETQSRNLLQEERDLLDQRVTERTQDLAKARDEAIRSSNELRKHFLAIEQSGNTIVITDKMGRIEYVNPKFGELTGYTPPEVIGQNPRILKSGAHSRAFYERLWKTISSGQVWQGELRNRRKDGSLFWESATIAPVQNHLGEITNYVAIKEDITARKELQEQLHQQNELMAQEIVERMQAEAQNVAFVQDIKALQEINLELNETHSLEDLYVQMISLSQKRLGLDRVGLFILDPVARMLRGTYGVDTQGNIRDERGYTEEISRDHWSAEIERNYNRAKIWEDAPIFDNGVEVGRGWKSAAALWNGEHSIGYIVADNFISYRYARPYEAELLSLLGSAFGHLIERAYAESRLQESESRFRQIVENASDLIYRADTEGKLIYVNPTSLRIMGCKDESELVGLHFTEVASPEWRSALKRFYYRQFLAKTPSTYYEFPATTMDGREIWLGQNVQIIWEGDEIVGFQAVARDITDIKQAQEALSLARDQALEASTIKGQLLSRVSHELRTPLGSILGYSELLRDDVYGAITEEQKEVVGNISHSANYLTSLVNDLLDEAQIAAKSLTLNQSFFKPGDLLKQLHARMSVLALNKGLELTVEAFPPLPETIYGDEKRLQQILINLTGNAIKFTRTGSVSVKIFQPDSAHWAMQVQDTGVGIASDAQQYIFEPFRQVDNSITRDNRGSGLGLSIVKQLADLMNGEIMLQSEAGQGSTFTVILPLVQPRGDTFS